jgi:PKD repeat protein
MGRKEFCIVLVVVLAIPIVAGCLEEQNKSPVAIFSVTPDKVNVGETVFFSANDSIDKDGRIVKYHWDFGDGSWDMGPFVEHVYEEGGEYTINLVVTDDSGAKNQENTTIEVNEWPKAQGNVEKDPVKINEVVMFDGSYSKDEDGKIVKYKWDFGDGTSVTGERPTHCFNKLGLQNITLEVEDDDGATDMHTFQIEVIKRKYTVYWNESHSVLDTFSDYTVENFTTNKTLDVDTYNLTKIVFEMKWSDHIPVIRAANDNFELTVITPDKDLKKYATTNETIVHSFTIDYLPSELTVKANNEDEVKNVLIADYTSDKGNGEWLMKVYCIEAGDIFESEFELDDGNDWEITVIAYYYTATIVEVG